MLFELQKARRRVGGRDTYICPSCGNGSGEDGDGICTKNGVHYKCFKCGFYGDYLDILKNQYRTTDEKDIFRMYNIAQLHTGQPKAHVQRIEQAAQPKGSGQEQAQDHTLLFLQAKKDLHEGSAGMRYLESRGISHATASRLGLGYAPAWRHPKRPGDAQDARIIIPTSPGSYLARALVNGRRDKLKVGSVEPFNLSVLYGTDPVFITEAEIDALSIEEVGGQACAIGASSMTGKFLRLIAEKPPTAPLILSLDNDEAGQRAQETLKAGLVGLGLSVSEANISGQYKDPNEQLVADRTAFTALVASAQTRIYPLQANKEASVAFSGAGSTVTPPQIPNTPESAYSRAEGHSESALSDAEVLAYKKTSAAHQLTAFMETIAIKQAATAVPTGFPELDAALGGGLYEGLYVIGAISSLGKTTFALQMADQVAASGTDVLVFSLEMSQHELMAKSLSRLTYTNGDAKNAKTLREIQSGGVSAEILSAYATYADKIFIHEGMGNIGTAEISTAVARHIELTGRRPVVIIDYLQILAPNLADARATDKQNVDRAVHALKCLSRDTKTSIIAISSFNRDNYNAPVNLASFKESGAIEYSSDVLIGLQLAGMDTLSQSPDRRADTLRQIEEKKGSPTRQIQLKILKNRNGQIGLNTHYDYTPAFNAFCGTQAPRPLQRR